MSPIEHEISSLNLQSSKSVHRNEFAILFFDHQNALLTSLVQPNLAFELFSSAECWQTVQKCFRLPTCSAWPDGDGNCKNADDNSIDHGAWS